MTTLLLNGEGVQVWRVGDNIYLHTNGRCVGVGEDQARLFHQALGAVLNNEYDRAMTPDQAEPSRPQTQTQTQTHPRLEDI